MKHRKLFQSDKKTVNVQAIALVTVSMAAFISLPNIATADADSQDGTYQIELRAPLEMSGLVNKESKSSSNFVELAPGWTEYSMGIHGGDGGYASNHVPGPGGVIYAVQINSGDFVDHLTFVYYYPSNPDNYYRSGDFYASVGPFGGNGGAANPWIYCPAGMGVIGIQGSSGQFVDRLGIICGDVNHPDPNSPTNWVSPVYGGFGGYWFSEACGTGYLLDAFNLRSGEYLDQIQGICISAH